MCSRSQHLIKRLINETLRASTRCDNYDSTLRGSGPFYARQREVVADHGNRYRWQGRVTRPTVK